MWSFTSRTDEAPISRFEIDFDGDGSSDLVSAAIPEKLRHTYAEPGLRVASARVTYADGSSIVSMVPVNAQAFTTMNALIKSVWRVFTQSVATGKIDEILRSFCTDSVREKYRDRLELIRESLPQFAEGIKTIDAVWIYGDVAHYLVTRIEDGRPVGYHVYFGRDENGLWKIVQF